MKKLKKTKKMRFCGSGSYGMYYKLSARRGVKIIDGAADTIKELKESNVYEEAKQELNLLRKARRRTNLVPNGYYLVAVKQSDGWSVGIVMTHINGRKPSDWKWDGDSDDFIKLNNKLESLGIFHGDLHGGNVKYRKGKYYVFDFSPDIASVI